VVSEARKVLLVEDEQELRLRYTRYLTDNGYAVSCAETGAIALQKVFAEDWDVMLLDTMLAGQDGVQVLKMVKANDRLKDKPVIALTGLAGDLDVDQIFDLGADGLLAKSELTSERLVTEIETVLQKYS